MDDKGNVTKVAANSSSTVTGNYLTSEGKQGDSAWGTRATWCMLYGKINNDTVSVAIIDHPEKYLDILRIGTRVVMVCLRQIHWEKIFSPMAGKNSTSNCKKVKSITFRYRIVIASGRSKIIG